MAHVNANDNQVNKTKSKLNPDNNNAVVQIDGNKIIYSALCTYQHLALYF